MIQRGRNRAHRHIARIGMTKPSSSGLLQGTDERAQPPVAPGDVIAEKYVVERTLGVGGMGIVVAARHKLLDHHVALKFVQGAREDSTLVRRLLREAQIIARMKSSHVVRVLDVGLMADGAPYLVMELLEGIDLQKRLDTDGRLPIDEAVSFVVQACEAIAEAHTQGIVHRDLKPSNLFLTTDVDERPLVKVLDFGISKPLGNVRIGSDITSPCDLMGTPMYMSPEQLRASPEVDARSDIWSLGVMLYELVSGTPPFEFKSLVDLCATVVRDPPRPLPSFVPTELSDVIFKCLAKEPADRFQKIGALVAALEPFTQGAARVSVERILRVQPTTLVPRKSSPELDTVDGGTGSQALAASTTLDAAPDSTPPPLATASERPRRSKHGSMTALIAVLVVVAGIVPFALRQRPTMLSRNEPVVATPAPPPPSATDVPAPIPGTEQTSIVSATNAQIAPLVATTSTSVRPTPKSNAAKRAAAQPSKAAADDEDRFLETR